jgi:hypothetical protein
MAKKAKGGKKARNETVADLAPVKKRGRPSPLFTFLRSHSPLLDFRFTRQRVHASRVSQIFTLEALGFGLLDSEREAGILETWWLMREI